MHRGVNLGSAEVDRKTLTDCKETRISFTEILHFTSEFFQTSFSFKVKDRSVLPAMGSLYQVST